MKYHEANAFNEPIWSLDHPGPVNKSHGVGTKRAVNDVNRRATVLLVVLI